MPKVRGFAAMHPDKVRAIASAGGKAAHKAGTAHEFTSEEARIAGSKGGKAAAAKLGRGKRFSPADAVDVGLPSEDDGPNYTAEDAQGWDGEP